MQSGVFERDDMCGGIMCGGIVVYQAQPVADLFAGDEYIGLAVFEHVGETVLRVVGVERQVCTARLENRHQGDNHLEAALKRNRDHRVGSSTKADQVTGKGVRACLKLCVTKCLALKHQRRRIRMVPGRPRQKIGQKTRVFRIQLLFGVVER